MYKRRPSTGFGKPAAAKPLKRPTQARAVFTVQAIYDAFVRIWQRDGWAGVTTQGLDARLVLPAISVEIALRDIYVETPIK